MKEIFIIDDRQYITNLLINMLSPYGFTIKTSNNSMHALQYLIKEHRNFDLVITDLTMPYLSGIDLIKKLNEVAPELAFIIITGQGDNLYEKNFEIVDAILQKPIMVDELLSTIQDIFD